MARPLKKGLAYFPLDTDMLSDRKIQRLLIRYGPEGLAVYLTVLIEIYRTNGYFLLFYEDLYFDISFTLKSHEKQVKKIILFCVEINLFNRNLLEEKEILTSRGIQSRFVEIEKRNKSEVVKEYLLVKDKAVVFATETDGIVTETMSSATKTPTKGKGNKKENKEEEKNKSKKKNYETGEFEQEENTDIIRHRELCRMAAEATAATTKRIVKRGSETDD